MNYRQLALLGLTPLLISCGGGGGGSSDLYSTSCIVQGSGLITCVSVPVGGGGTPEREPSAAAFPVKQPINQFLANGFVASGYYSNPYTQAGTYTLTKTVSSQIFNGQQTTAVVTTTNWPTTSTIIPSWTGYITPYTLHFDTSGNLFGFEIDGLYGVRSAGTGFPTSANIGESGVAGQFQVFSDQALTVPVGTATASWAVANCCDLWSKKNGQLTLTIKALNPNGSSRFNYYVKLGITTDGAFRIVVEDSFTDSGGSNRYLYLPGGS